MKSILNIKISTEEFNIKYNTLQNLLRKYILQADENKFFETYFKLMEFEGEIAKNFIQSSNSDYVFDKDLKNCLDIVWKNTNCLEPSVLSFYKSKVHLFNPDKLQSNIQELEKIGLQIYITLFVKKSLKPGEDMVWYWTLCHLELLRDFLLKTRME